MTRYCLVVDDSKIVRKVARKIMESLAFTVDEAENGMIAVQYCESRKPELILLDWYMPEMNGLDFLKRLRNMHGGGAPKVIFCTTENNLPHIMEALSAGADEYVMKPFDMDIIKGKVSQIGLI
jgi:two-component system chemotaxis response regulator CheY